MNIKEVQFKAKPIVRDKEGHFILEKGFKIVPSHVLSNMALSTYNVCKAKIDNCTIL